MAAGCADFHATRRIDAFSAPDSRTLDWGNTPRYGADWNAAAPINGGADGATGVPAGRAVSGAFEFRQNFADFPLHRRGQGLGPMRREDLAQIVVDALDQLPIGNVL
jgi:hypothetical protein